MGSHDAGQGAFMRRNLVLLATLLHVVPFLQSNCCPVIRKRLFLHRRKIHQKSLLWDCIMLHYRAPSCSGSWSVLQHCFNFAVSFFFLFLTGTAAQSLIIGWFYAAGYFKATRNPAQQRLHAGECITELFVAYL